MKPASRIGQAGGILLICVATVCHPRPVLASEPRVIQDAVITAKVKTAILLNRQLDSFRINVETRNAEVTLNGLVPDAPRRELAAEIARTVEGVNRVRNRLRIDREGEEPPSPEDRTFTQKVRDASIVAAVKSALLLRKGIRTDRIEVQSQWGVVTLGGTVRSAAERRLVIGIAADMWDVRAVRDHLDLIRDPVAQEAPVGEESHLSDLLITSQVQTALSLSRRVENFGITVQTEGGTVTLSGRVSSRRELKEAVRIAEGTWGVGRVLNQLEVVSARKGKF